MKSRTSKRTWTWLQFSDRALQGFLLQGLKFSIRHPKKILLLLFAFMVPAVFGLFKLKTLLAMEDVVDPTFVSKQQLNSLMEDFKIHSSSILALRSPPAGWTDESLCAVSRWITRQRIENEHLVSSLSPLDVRDVQVTETHLLYPRIFRPSCMEETPSHTLTFQEIESQRSQFLQTPWAFSLLGREGQDFIIQFDFHDAPSEGRYGTFDPLVVEKLQQSFDREVLPQVPGLKASWLGSSDFQYFFYMGLKRVNVLNLALVVLLIVAFKIIFGNWRLGILYTGTLVLSGLACYGFMGLFQVPVDVLSKSLFLMIAVSALEDVVYLAAKMKELNGDWKKSWRRILLPGFLTSFTTALGFLSLCISDLSIIRRFGFWAAAGSMFEFFIVFFCLPALFMLFPWWSQFVETSKGNAFRIFSKVRFLALPRRLSFVLLALMVGAPAAFQRLNINDVPLEMFSDSHPFKRAVVDMKARNGWETQAQFVITEEVHAERAKDLISKVRQMPEVVNGIGGHDFLEYAMDRTPVPTTKELIQSQLSSASFMQSWITSQNKRRFAVFLTDGTTATIRSLQEKIMSLCPQGECHLTGVPVVYSEFARQVPQTLLESFLLSLVLVSAVLVWLSTCRGQLRNVHWILLSSFWGPAVMFIIISVLQIKVNFLTCVFASVLVGLTGDNAIQFLIAARKKNLLSGVESGGGAALVSGFLMGSSSLIFLGSYFIPPRIFGLLLMGGFVLSTLGDYWLLKAFVGGKNASDDR